MSGREFEYRWINEAIQNTSAKASWLEDGPSIKALIRELCCRYFEPGNGLDWEAMLDCVSRRRRWGQGDICDFVQANPCLMLTENLDLLLVESGQDLRLIFDDTPRFDHFVFDHALTYVICVNDHDYLIGAGASCHFISGLTDQIN